MESTMLVASDEISVAVDLSVQLGEGLRVETILDELERRSRERERERMRWGLRV